MIDITCFCKFVKCNGWKARVGWGPKIKSIFLLMSYFTLPSANWQKWQLWSYLPLTHFGILPPCGSWWWNCRTMTVTTTDIPTIIMVLAKYWAVEKHKKKQHQRACGLFSGILLTTSAVLSWPSFMVTFNKHVLAGQTLSFEWIKKKWVDFTPEHKRKAKLISLGEKKKVVLPRGKCAFKPGKYILRRKKEERNLTEKQ